MQALGSHRLRTLAVGLGLALAAVSLAGAAPSSAPPTVPPAEFGEVFPSGTFDNLNVGVGGPPRIDLKDLIGKRPIVFCYWIPEHPRSEEIFQQLQALAEEQGAGKLVLYGVATPPAGLSPAAASEWVKVAKERIVSLKIRVPVLRDEGFRIGQQMAVRSAPAIAVLDASGRLRMTNAGALRQTLEYKMDVASAIRRVASTGTLGTYGAVPTYYPASELAGKKVPDFEARVLGSPSKSSWSALQAPDRLNILIFWSVDCPHCRKSLPEINRWLKQHRDGYNVVTAARVTNDAMRTKTEEFCRQEEFTFTTLEDDGQSLANLFLITSTPTVFVIRPDGVVDSVLLSGETDFPATFEARRAKLLRPPRS